MWTASRIRLFAEWFDRNENRVITDYVDVNYLSLRWSFVMVLLKVLLFVTKHNLCFVSFFFPWSFCVFPVRYILPYYTYCMQHGVMIIIFCSRSSLPSWSVMGHHDNVTAIFLLLLGSLYSRIINKWLILYSTHRYLTIFQLYEKICLYVLELLFVGIDISHFLP